MKYYVRIYNTKTKNEVKKMGPWSLEIAQASANETFSRMFHTDMIHSVEVVSTDGKKRYQYGKEESKKK